MNNIDNMKYLVAKLLAKGKMLNAYQCEINYKFNIINVCNFNCVAPGYLI